MKVLAVIFNIFLPGVGTFFTGQIGLAVGQLLLYIVGVLASFIFIGIPIVLGVWIWGIVTAANWDPNAESK